MGAARDDWWKTYFQGVASEFTRRAVAPRSVADAARIERVLGLSESSTILDVPCGHGRIAIELAARGHRVTGLDFAPEEIACAKQAALERNVTIDVRVGDMRTDVPAESFDATVCFGHSFGYFTDEENAAFLRAAYGSLRPGGQFALETALCLDSYLPRLGEVSRPQWAKVGDTYLLQQDAYDPDSGRVNSEQTFLTPGTGAVETRRLSCRLYTYRELVGLMRSCGFEEVRGLDATGDGPFQVGRPLLLLGRHPA